MSTVRTFNSLCVFCGSATGVNPAHAGAARATGRLMAERGIRLVYGGGNVGIMGAVADAVLDAGGEVTGVIPDFLVEREAAHSRLSDMRVVRTMHERKALMAELSDGFITLPGGMGTLEELCETLAWSQLNLHNKPVGLLNVAGYYDGLIAVMDGLVSEGFLKPKYRGLLIEEREPARLIEAMASWSGPHLDTPAGLERS